MPYSSPAASKPGARIVGALGDTALTDGRLMRDLSRQFGTPLFVYDAAILERSWRTLRAALPPRYEIYYSIKANPAQAFLRYFMAKGCGLEVASDGEIHQALAAGCDAGRIVFAGPGKTDAELALAVALGLGEVHVESVAEVARLASVSQARGVTTPVALRINPGAEVQGGAMRMGGTATPFGIDEEDLDAAVDCVLAEAHLRLEGIHLFVGTQMLDAGVVLAQHARALDIARRTAQRCGRPLATVDMGGGLGIPYFERDRPLDLGGLSAGLTTLVRQIEGDPMFEGTRLIVEPGRYLVGPCGVYLASVVDVKRSRDKTFVVIDGGMHHHLAASGNLGQTIKRNFPIALLDRLDANPAERVDLVGPLCTPLDVLGRAVDLPRVAAGDLVGLFHSGAYARSASPLGFLSHPSPPEVWVEHGSGRLIRRRGSRDAALADQIAIPQEIGA